MSDAHLDLLPQNGGALSGGMVSVRRAVGALRSRCTRSGARRTSGDTSGVTTGGGLVGLKLSDSLLIFRKGMFLRPSK